MMPPPKAMSHGLGGGAGATFGAFAGISAANAVAVETASAATTDNTTFFIGACPFNSTGLKAGPLCLFLRKVRRKSRNKRRKPAKKRRLHGNLDLWRPVAASQKRRQLLPF